MKTISILAVLLLSALPLGAQEPTTQEPGDRNRQPEPLLSFDFRLAPTSQGALEGFARIDLFWWEYLSSGVDFAVTNFTSVYDEYGGSTTSIDSNKVLTVDILKTRDNLFKLSWAEDFYVSFNAGISTSISWLAQEKYGHGEIPVVFAYYSKQDIFSVKPLARAELELAFGILSAQGYVSLSPFAVYTHTEGEFFFSTVGAKVEYSLDDASNELKCGGLLLFTPLQDLEINLGFNYTWYSGTAAGAAAGFASVENFPYEADEYEVLGSVSFNILSFRPILGISYVYYKFRPRDMTAAVSYASDRFRFTVGMITD
jgi:hypothetical protein